MMKKIKIKEPELTETAREIARKRYLRTNMEGEVIETPGEMLWRVAKHMAKAEIEWGSNDRVEEVARKFYERMVSLKMVCAGKAMFEAGNSGGTGQLSSCFVLPIKDSIKSIFKTLGEAAVVHKNNGGTGFNFSRIRPHGDKVKNVPRAASGPVDFIRAYSAALAQILQGAKRQGANIAILNVDHPDVLDFIYLKDSDGTIKNFNLSVGITDEFMRAVEQDKFWRLINPRNGEVVKRIKAKKLFHLIAEQAWKTGDPGLAFLDTMERGNTVPGFGKLEATNPCGEIALFPYESCNLTSLDLARHLRRSGAVAQWRSGWELDWEELEKSVKLGVRFLDNMIEVNNYPLKEIEQTVKYGNRRIGLGVMGFADALYRLKIPYNSEAAVKLAKKYAKFIYEKAVEASQELAEERGNFLNWDLSIYPIKKQKMRNCAVTMIAPTGTISMLANTSSGIEPVFSLVTIRRTFYEDDKNNHSTKELVLIDPVLEEVLRQRIRNEEKLGKAIKQIAEGDLGVLTEEERKVFVTTHQIAPKWHVKIQAAWQKYFDNSISKTINFRNEATVDEVKEAFWLAWRSGCKGITIYRDGSKSDQVLLTQSAKRKAQDHSLTTQNYEKHGEMEICPECGGKLHKTEGCVKCYDCGWSACG